MCNKCNELHRRVREKPVCKGPGSFPSTKDLAYMVNLEYYIQMGQSCIHEIPDKDNVKEMREYLDKNLWEQTGKTNNDGFRCSVFLNRPAKQVVVVHRGTELTNITQVKTDIQLSLNIVTRQTIKNADWHTMQALMNNALKEENLKFVRNDWSVTITGHSLGGWLAQMCTLLSKYPKYNALGPRGVWSFGNNKSIDLSQSYELHCVAFDSPGASNILNRLEKNTKEDALLKGEEREVENALKSLDITIYKSNPNVVNLCGRHYGKVYEIDVLKDEWFWTRWNPISSHSMDRIWNYFKNK